MTVPDYQSLMGPALSALIDGEAKTTREHREQVAVALALTEDDLRETIPSGAPLFSNRLHWATTYLAQAGLVARPKRGVVQITPLGTRTFRERGESIDNSLLAEFAEFRDFQTRARQSQRPRVSMTRTSLTSSDEESVTPTESIEAAIEEANEAVASQLLKRVRDQEPAFLERLVLDLLTAMGFGGLTGEAMHRGQSGDEGIDGVIRRDALGLENIYVQAKRYAADRPISRPDIQAFVGALQGQQADRGVFITTSRFTREAADYADRVNARVVLIDGDYLARLMIRFGVGVQNEATYVIKKVDEDFFSEE